MTTTTTTTTTTTARVPAITADIFGSVLTLTFADGRVLTLDTATLTDDIRHAAMLHGLKQKLVDGAAIARNPETGRSATLDDKFNAVREIYDRITDPAAPAWNKGRSGGEGDGSNTLLLRALCKMSGKSPAVMAALLESKTKEEKKALRANPKVAAIIAEIQAERLAQQGIDGEALLDELL
jgi:hypothetical protein